MKTKEHKFKYGDRVVLRKAPRGGVGEVVTTVNQTVVGVRWSSGSVNFRLYVDSHGFKMHPLTELEPAPDDK